MMHSKSNNVLFTTGNRNACVQFHPMRVLILQKIHSFYVESTNLARRRVCLPYHVTQGSNCLVNE